jgi:hypothetical protein
MPSLKKAAANALIQLANSDNQIVARYHLRTRSKLNQPNRQNCTHATLDHIIAAATILDHNNRNR